MTLDMGFLEQVDGIASHFPEDLQMMVFSATIPQGLRPFLKKYMENPVVEEIPTETVINPNVDNWLMSTKGRDKNEMIYQLLTLGDPYLALIFANTRQRAEEITDYLQQQGLKVALSQEHGNGSCARFTTLTINMSLRLIWLHGESILMAYHW